MLEEFNGSASTVRAKKEIFPVSFFRELNDFYLNSPCDTWQKMIELDRRISACGQVCNKFLILKRRGDATSVIGYKTSLEKNI